MFQPTQIKSEIQLAVEGNDQRNFFEAFVDHHSVPNIQVQNFGGVNDLSGFLLALTDAPGFTETVRRLGIVRDAEACAVSAFQSVLTSLRRANLPLPRKPLDRTDTRKPDTIVLILPDSSRQGMLETLLCESFAGGEEDRCIDVFFECIETIPDRMINRRQKARAHAYFGYETKSTLFSRCRSQEQLLESGSSCI